MDAITRIISLPNAISTIFSNHSLREQGIHDNIESMYVSGGWIAEYTVFVGSGGMFLVPIHSHIPVLADKKNIILSHIGRDYEPYYRFSFIMEDTMCHTHSAKHVYYCMDDDEGGVALYVMELDDNVFSGKLVSPVKCHRTIEVMGHSHTITLVRHQMIADAATASDSDTDMSNSASGAEPTAP